MQNLDRFENKVAADMKGAYQAKADTQLAEWHARIEHLKSDASTVHLKLPADRQRLVQRLEDCHRIARVRLDELSASQDERWELAKQAVERAMIELKRALDESGVEQAGKFLNLQSSRSHVYEPFPKKKGS